RNHEIDRDILYHRTLFRLVLQTPRCLVQRARSKPTAFQAVSFQQVGSDGSFQPAEHVGLAGPRVPPMKKPPLAGGAGATFSRARSLPPSGGSFFKSRLRLPVQFLHACATTAVTTRLSLIEPCRFADTLVSGWVQWTALKVTCGCQRTHTRFAVR